MWMKEGPCRMWFFYSSSSSGTSNSSGAIYCWSYLINTILVLMICLTQKIQMRNKLNYCEQFYWSLENIKIIISLSIRWTNILESGVEEAHKLNWKWMILAIYYLLGCLCMLIHEKMKFCSVWTTCFLFNWFQKAQLTNQGLFGQIVIVEQTCHRISRIKYSRSRYYNSETHNSNVHNSKPEVYHVFLNCIFIFHIIYRASKKRSK